MKRNTGWILITVAVLFLSVLLIPIGNVTHSKGGASTLTTDRLSRAGGLDLKGMARLKPKGLAPQEGDKSAGPISAQAVAFAVSEPLRDLPDAKAAAGMDIE